METQAADEVVLEVGAEGGSYTLVRRPTQGGGWKYLMVVNQVVLADLLDDDDDGGSSGDEPVVQSAAVDSFEEGLALLDERPYWIRLEPIVVHPDFRARVLAAVVSRMKGNDALEERQRYALERWREVCGEAAAPHR